MGQKGSQQKVSALTSSRAAPLVIVSGLPASGKTTLSRKLSDALSLPLLDKDDILEAMFDTLGVGDAAWRQRLSRASDEILQVLVRRSAGAVVTSFWRHPGVSSLSGTPTGWVASASTRVVEIYCECDPRVAADRFLQRERHPGHLDGAKRWEDLLYRFRDLAARGPLGVGPLLRVDTTAEVYVASLLGEVKVLLDLE